MAEIGAQRIPMLGGIATWGVAVGSDSVPKPFVRLPPGINPLDVRGETTLVFKKPDEDRVEIVKIPHVIQPIDKHGNPTPIIKMSVRVLSTEHDGPDNLSVNDTLGYYGVDKLNSMDVGKLILEHIRNEPLPEIDIQAGKPVVKKARIEVDQGSGPPLFLKALVSGHEEFINVRSLEIEVSFERQEPLKHSANAI